MKNILTAMLFSIATFPLMAQDPHLSQFYMAPVYLNPALTGAFEGNYRISGLFRSQWAAVLKNEAVPMYRTYTFSAEFKTNKGFSPGDAFGVGLSFLGDQAGDIKYGYNVIGVSAAYHKALDSRQHHYLAVGFSTQFYQQTIDYTNIQFGNQWQGNGFNPATNSGEQTPDSKLKYWDVNAGLLWYASHIGKSHRTDAYLGASAFHLNAPAISVFGDSKVRLNRKYVVHGGISFPLSARFEVQPKFILMNQGNWVETMWAADVAILLNPNSGAPGKFHLGAMFRMVGGNSNAGQGEKKLNPESIILTAGVDWKGLNLSLAYDVTVSRLISATGSKGGFEVGLNYTGKWHQHTAQTIYCPKF